MPIVSWHWDFGDGGSSTEQNPVHTYTMAGKYIVTEEVTNENGLSDSASTEIYVKDFVQNPVLSEDYLHVAYTTECYRVAVKTGNGVGIVPWGGDNWLYPTCNYGAKSVIDEFGDGLSLVLHNENGRFYQIGIEDLWVDREDEYGGQEIPCSVTLKEHRA